MARKTKGQSGQHGGQHNGKRRRGKSGNGYLVVLFVALVTIIAGIIIIDRYGDIIFKPAVEKALKTDKGFKEIKIYFSDEEGTRLVPERRIVKVLSLEAEVREALEILLAGPNDSRLASPIPQGARIRSVRIKDGLAIIDLSEEIAFKHTGGSSGELQTVYSIVNTVALNFPQIKLVELLIQGKKASTLAGHIDISQPFVPDRKIIKPNWESTPRQTKIYIARAASTPCQIKRQGVRPTPSALNQSLWTHTGAFTRLAPLRTFQSAVSVPILSSSLPRLR